MYVNNLANGDEERFIVSLILGYDPARDNIVSPEQAVAAALAFTREGNNMRANDVYWFVYDRWNQVGTVVRQGSIEALAEEMTP